MNIIKTTYKDGVTFEALTDTAHPMSTGLITDTKVVQRVEATNEALGNEMVSIDWFNGELFADHQTFSNALNTFL